MKDYRKSLVMLFTILCIPFSALAKTATIPIEHVLNRPMIILESSDARAFVAINSSYVGSFSFVFDLTNPTSEDICLSLDKDNYVFEIKSENNSTVDDVTTIVHGLINVIDSDDGICIPSNETATLQILVTIRPSVTDKYRLVLKEIGWTSESWAGMIWTLWTPDFQTEYVFIPGND